MSLLTMMAAFGPALDALNAALGADRFGRLLSRLGDLKLALRTEARASFAEFVADVARLDSWKGVTVASSVRFLEVRRKGEVTRNADMRTPAVRRKRRAGRR